LVQSELHPENEGREGDGNPGEPHADAPAPGLSEAVTFGASPAPFDPSQAAMSDEVRMANAGARLAQVQEELVAWIKTLFSAAVYAILIVTFGFQMARVEGLSLGP